jgi:hypothetical protein
MRSALTRSLPRMRDELVRLLTPSLAAYLDVAPEPRA